MCVVDMLGTQRPWSAWYVPQLYQHSCVSNQSTADEMLKYMATGKTAAQAASTWPLHSTPWACLPLMPICRKQICPKGSGHTCTNCNTHCPTQEIEHPHEISLKHEEHDTWTGKPLNCLAWHWVTHALHQQLCSITVPPSAPALLARRPVDISKIIAHPYSPGNKSQRGHQAEAHTKPPDQHCTLAAMHCTQTCWWQAHFHRNAQEQQLPASTNQSTIST